MLNDNFSSPKTPKLHHLQLQKPGFEQKFVVLGVVLFCCFLKTSKSTVTPPMCTLTRKDIIFVKRISKRNGFGMEVDPSGCLQKARPKPVNFVLIQKAHLDH